MLHDRSPKPLRTLADLAPEDTYVLAVDLGTGGPKVAVVSATGRIAAHAFEPVGITFVQGGGAEQDAHQWWSTVVSCARKAIADSGVSPDHIVGVGCTAQWSGTVPVDDSGEVIGYAVSWMDSRGADVVRRSVRGRINMSGYDARKVSRWIRRSGGAPSLSGKDPLGHILFLKEQRPEAYQAAAVFLEPVDFLNLQLAGVARASFDSITLHWVTDNRTINRVAYDPKLLKMSGLDRAKLPELLATCTIIGGLTDEAATELGLRAGTPVATGTGDLHSAAVGSGAVDDFAGHLYIGTSSWISCHVPFKKTSVATNITSIPSGLPGRYLVADEHETGGACLSWLCDNLLYPAYGLHGTGLASGGQSESVPKDALSRMNDVAASAPPGARGVMFTPWLNGERSPVDDHTIRAGFHNMSLSTTRADLVRAVFEGVAFNSRWLLGAVEKFIDKPFSSLAFVGGGANSDLWSQIHADVLGRTIRQVEDPVLANVRGAGLLTLLALDRVRLSEVPAMVAVKSEYHPDPENAPIYDEMSEEFVNFYKQTKGIYRRLNRSRLGGGGTGKSGSTSGRTGTESATLG